MQPLNKEKPSVEEYKLLKAEVTNWANMRYNTIHLLYMAVAAILAFAVANGHQLLFLIP